jgi:NTE family protein
MGMAGTWRALVLSGGGVKGEFQLGALECVRDRTDWEFDFLTGVSVGALNVAILAQHERLGQGLGKLITIWDSIRGNRDVYTGGSIAIGALLSLFTRSSIAKDAIFNSAPVASLIQRNVRWGDFKHGFSVGVTSLTDGMPYTITNLGPVLDAKPRNGRTLSLNLEAEGNGSIPAKIASFILASASMPLLFPTVEIYGHKFVDGGVRDVTPLSSAFDAAKAAVSGGWHGDMIWRSWLSRRRRQPCRSRRPKSWTADARSSAGRSRSWFTKSSATTLTSPPP